MQVRRKIAVAGATGRVGRHVVDLLKAGGHEVVAMSRSSGVDLVTGSGLAEALADPEKKFNKNSINRIQEMIDRFKMLDFSGTGQLTPVLAKLERIVSCEDPKTMSESLRHDLDYRADIAGSLSEISDSIRSLQEAKPMGVIRRRRGVPKNGEAEPAEEVA